MKRIPLPSFSDCFMALSWLFLIVGIWLLIDATFFVPLVRWRWGYTNPSLDAAGLHLAISLALGATGMIYKQKRGVTPKGVKADVKNDSL